MTAEAIMAALAPVLPGVSLEPLASADQAVTPGLVVPRQQIAGVCRALARTPGLEYVAFSDVTAVDYAPRREPRFDVVYHLVSPHRRARLRLVVRAGEGEAVPTITPVFPGAGWPEREVYDLFGIVFEGHPDLRRLLMPEDWEGHPLRKDYPVQIRQEVQTYMPLQVTEEEFRASLARDRLLRPRGPGPAPAGG